MTTSTTFPLAPVRHVALIVALAGCATIPHDHAGGGSLASALALLLSWLALFGAQSSPLHRAGHAHPVAHLPAHPA